MKDILVYQPPGSPVQVASFIEGLEPKLREKLLRQIIPLPRMRGNQAVCGAASV